MPRRQVSLGLRVPIFKLCFHDLISTSRPQIELCLVIYYSVDTPAPRI